MAVVELRHTATVLREDGGAESAELAARCDVLTAQIDDGIRRHGIVDRPELGGRVLAYEVDGFGNANMMDDANVPSLLSLPWLGYMPVADDVYQRTRKYILSGRTNPWFFSGTDGEGVGSPHTGPGALWPMGLIMRALTSTHDDEIRECLATLKRSASQPGSWLMHESFNVDDASSYTRPWFAWANSLFGALLIKLSIERPHLIGIQTT